jgi:hypothetical protein
MELFIMVSQKVTTSFKIEKELLKKLKLQAIEEETNSSEIIVRAIKLYFKQLDKQTTLDNIE